MGCLVVIKVWASSEICLKRYSESTPELLVVREAPFGERAFFLAGSGSSPKNRARTSLMPFLTVLTEAPESRTIRVCPP